MKQELLTLVQQHLPSLAAGEMRTYIEQAEKDKRELSDLRETLEKLNELCANANNELASFRAQEARLSKLQDDLNKREGNVKQREFNAKVAELTYQLEAELKSKDSIFKLVETFVANARAIETISKNRYYSHGTDYSPSGGTRHFPQSHTEVETREVKETKTL